jgi:hypothetical protein
MYYHTGNMSTSLQYHHCQFIYLKLNEPVQSVLLALEYEGVRKFTSFKIGKML